MKYKLLKDIPGANAGTIFTQWNDPSEIFSPEGKEFPRVNKAAIEDITWFEPINEWPKSWEELKCDGYYINGAKPSYPTSAKCVFPTDAHAKSSLAFAQLSQLAKAINGDWEPDWIDVHLKYTVKCMHDKLAVDSTLSIKYLICFETKEAAEFSLKHHRKLWEDYWIISK
jgi:hypothetical protein